MKRRHPVKIKPNQHRGGLVGSILKPGLWRWCLCTHHPRSSVPSFCSGSMGPGRQLFLRAGMGESREVWLYGNKTDIREKVKPHPVPLLQDIVMVFVIEFNIMIPWYMKMGRKKIAEYQRKTEAGCFLFASFLGWAKARKGSQVPIVAVTLILE